MVASTCSSIRPSTVSSGRTGIASARSAKYNAADPNKGHDHTFFIQHSRDVFAD